MNDLTDVLHWLRPSNWAGVELGKAAQTLDVITELQAENERLRERAEELTKLCSDRLCQRWDDNKEYRAEIDRLRWALEKIAAVTCHDTPSAVQAWEERGRIAREALRQEGDDE